MKHIVSLQWHSIFYWLLFHDFISLRLKMDEMTKEIEKNGTSWNSFVFSVALQETFLRNYLLKCSCDDCNASIHAWDSRIPFTFLSLLLRLTTVYFPLVRWKFNRKENKPFQQFDETTKKAEDETKKKWKTIFPQNLENVWNISHLLVVIAEKSCKILSSAFQTCKRQHVVNLKFSRFQEINLLLTKY